MTVHASKTLPDGTTLALIQYNPGWYWMGMRLVRLKPGLAADGVYRINQKGGGIELLRVWRAPFNKNPGPNAGWTKVLAASKNAFERMTGAPHESSAT